MNVSTKQQRIAEITKRKRDEPITLLHHYLDEEWLKVAFSKLKEDKATGIDRQTVEEYARDLENNVESLLNRSKSGNYHAPPVRKSEIPKPGSKEKRELGIPTTEDKVLQKAVTMLLEPIYEQEFLYFSYGFRPGRSPHQALEQLSSGIATNNIGWIIDLDIRNFFGTVRHDKLQELLRKRVRDGVVLRLVGKWLKAGIMKGGNVTYSDIYFHFAFFVFTFYFLLFNSPYKEIGFPYGENCEAPFIGVFRRVGKFTVYFVSFQREFFCFD